ncbi:hypothetical protein Ppb6_02357 [Photorhabdus australis subsp. thailandensis]|uniref:Uncharacterized protein n=1 Tax=Photorhabdus australis subsp. thailandensis TaxID=2805096 RepID=A0A1C0U2X6_9GAMM|nr:hypothetical protein [Photorhabdus australis]OCQ52284.1 hypothetical protein Ppb6_02357 [Photorhabdus australis subsp. thailandensis]
MDKSQYSEKWQTRFAFFEQHDAPKSLGYIYMGMSCMFAGIWGETANYAYYLKETVNSQSSNPFEGFY